MYTNNRLWKVQHNKKDVNVDLQTALTSKHHSSVYCFVSIHQTARICRSRLQPWYAPCDWLDLGWSWSSVAWHHRGGTRQPWTGNWWVWWWYRMLHHCSLRYICTAEDAAINFKNLVMSIWVFWLLSYVSSFSIIKYS